MMQCNGCQYFVTEVGNEDLSNVCDKCVRSDPKNKRDYFNGRESSKSDYNDKNLRDLLDVAAYSLTIAVCCFVAALWFEQVLLLLPSSLLLVVCVLLLKNVYRRSV